MPNMDTGGQDIKILPEDKVRLTNDQKNLIELALVKQIPPEDAKYIQRVKNTGGSHDSYPKLHAYYVKKYGADFGAIYLSALVWGENKYKETIKFIEKLRALERIEKQKKN